MVGALLLGKPHDTGRLFALQFNPFAVDDDGAGGAFICVSRPIQLPKSALCETTCNLSVAAVLKFPVGMCEAAVARAPSYVSFTVAYFM